MNLKLEKNLIVLDIESTGVNFVSDKIIELFLLKVKPNGETKEYLQRFNPGMPIPKQASEVHGITDEMVANEPSFAEKAPEILNFIGDADLAGFNSNKFDVPMLMEELGRCGFDLQVEKRKLIDVQRIFHQMEPRNLEAAYRFYCNKDLSDAHTAKADTIATWEILQAQVDKYKELENSVDSLHRFTASDSVLDLTGRIVYNNQKEPVFNFGKHKGKTVKEIFTQEPSYYEWIMRSDFSMQTKKVVTRLRLEMSESKS
jgi:DNA polymerase-3 subunit epsilon